MENNYFLKADNNGFFIVIYGEDNTMIETEISPQEFEGLFQIIKSKAVNSNDTL